MNMRERFNNYTITRPLLKKVVGWSLVLVGFIGIVAPIVPGAPILYVGLEILGLRIIFTDRMKRVFIKSNKSTSLTEIISDKNTV